MPRRREIPKRELAADPVYSSTLVTKFINTVMSDGKKSTAERILYKSFDIIKERTGDDPLKVFKKALDNVKPSLEVKSRRVGGSNYQVPVEVNPNRRLSLSIRWITGYALERGDGKTMQQKLANEFLDAVGEPHAGDFAQRGIRLLRRLGEDTHADAALLRAVLQRGALRLADDLLAPGAHQLRNSRHKRDTRNADRGLRNADCSRRHVRSPHFAVRNTRNCLFRA